MPGLTPAWGIRYPFVNELIDPAAFKDFADDVDASLDVIQAAQNTAATGRLWCKVSRAEGPDTLAQNVATDVVWTTQASGDDPGNWWTSGANIILPARGLYQVFVFYGQHNNILPTTVASQMVRVKVNGTYRLGRRYVPIAPATITDRNACSGVVYCASAGHALAATYSWHGTGGPIEFPDMVLEVTQLIALP
jgi:hypothetical protein